jgi:hypothetical protein
MLTDDHGTKLDEIANLNVKSMQAILDGHPAEADLWASAAARLVVELFNEITLREPRNSDNETHGGENT